MRGPHLGTVRWLRAANSALKGSAMPVDQSWDIAPLLIETRAPGDVRAVITVAGEMDRDNCGDIRVAVGEVLYRDGLERISINLSRLTFLDSSGIRELLLCRRDARLCGCELDLVDVHPHVHQVLDVSGLLAEFSVG